MDGSPHWPVSVKGVLAWDGNVVVLRNERDEWELPGGRLEADDPTPESALRREFVEELGLAVEVGELIDSWIYDVAGKRVLIVTYACTAEEPAKLGFSDEHSAVALIDLAGLRAADMPDGYLRAIERVVA